MIVEDSLDTLSLLSTMFQREGANVTTATSAAEALRCAVTKRPNIVISDIGMPDVDGYQLLEQVKQFQDWTRYPRSPSPAMRAKKIANVPSRVGYLGQTDRVDPVFETDRRRRPPTVPWKYIAAFGLIHVCLKAPSIERFANFQHYGRSPKKPYVNTTGRNAAIPQAKRRLASPANL